MSHTDRAHALLSASSASRWMACTPSARCEALFPDRTTDYAAEGTCFHELVEAVLKDDRGAMDRCRRSQYYDQEMEDAAQATADKVRTSFGFALSASRESILQLEVRVDLTRWVPDGYGTADCVIVTGKHIAVVDYKYGKGVKVSAENNPQLRLYALGVLEEYGWMYGTETVELVILQPRLDNVSKDVISADDLRAWGETVHERAVMAYMGDGAFVAGDHCRFCKAREHCRAMRDMAFQAVEQPEPVLLTDAEIAEALGKVEAISSWADGLKRYALSYMLEGNRLPGYKVVEGVSRRRITDEQGALGALEAAGYDRSAIVKPQEIQTLGALEKTVGKKRLAEIIGAYITKPKGSPTIVPESDPRQDYVADAAERFKGISE